MEEFKGRDIAFVSNWLTKKVFKRSLLKTTGAADDCSSVGYDRKSDDGVGHLTTILPRGGGNLSDPIFESSNARALPGKRGRGDVEVSSRSAHYPIVNFLLYIIFFLVIILSGSQ